MSSRPGAGPTIDRLDAWRVPVGLHRPHVMSFGTVEHVDQIVVRVTADGVVGWGEVSILGGPYWGEESAESVLGTLLAFLFPATVGSGLLDPNALRQRWDEVKGNAFAKCALDIAVMDAVGQATGLSVSRLLGGRVRDSVPLSWSLAAPTVADDVAEARAMYGDGHRIFKVKVGSAPVADDVRRLAALREALDDDARLRVDANQGWGRPDAGVAVRHLASLGLDFIEQPLVRADIAGLAALQRDAEAPLMADESLVSLRDAARLVELDAARVFALKLAKHGGLCGSYELGCFAAATGVGTYVGCMIETGIGTAAALQLAAALPRLEFGCELFGPLLLVDDLAAGQVEYSAGRVHVPTGPGLGVQVDVDQVADSATAHVHLDRSEAVR